jgi:L-lactate dehydrogenase complex protein LldG
MDKSIFLARISSQLRRKATSEPPARAGALDLPPVQVQGNLARRFQNEIIELKGEIYFEPDSEVVSERLKALLSDLNPKSCVAWDRKEFSHCPLDWLWHSGKCLPFDISAAERWKQVSREADVGITSADFAVAETGSLLLTASPSRPRSASLLPSCHIVLLRGNRIVPTLEDALERYFEQAGPQLPSALLLITGPSRTSDIENDLSIGVHGPGRLIVVVDRS